MSARTPSGPGDVRLRIVLTAPPPGAAFCLQRGSAETVGAARSTGADLVFECAARVRSIDPPDFGGPFVQGPRGGRFIYICSGRRAGDFSTGWDRRAKIPLAGITAGQLEAALARREARLVARIAGKAKDGGPACASVPVLGGWIVEEGSDNAE